VVPAFRLISAIIIILLLWNVNEQACFMDLRIYCPVRLFQGGIGMRESDDPRTDLEDLIYDEDAKAHSER
jgi:hypothetical protein